MSADQEKLDRTYDLTTMLKSAGKDMCAVKENKNRFGGAVAHA